MSIPCLQKARLHIRKVLLQLLDRVLIVLPILPVPPIVTPALIPPVSPLTFTILLLLTARTLLI